MPPAHLLAAGRDEIARYGVEFVTDQVVGIEPGFFVRLAGGRVLRARRILLTTGVRDELPDVPGVHERWGRDLLHCPYCHGWEVRDQPLGVLNTGPGAVQHAQLIRQWTDDLVFFTHTAPITTAERVQLQARGIQIVHGEVTGLIADDDRLTGVQLADGRVIARTAVFIRPAGASPSAGPLNALGVRTDDAGIVAVDASGRTTAYGVWAAGNAVDPRAQVIAAAGAANTAAIALNADLVAEDVERAVDVHHAAGEVFSPAAEARLALAVLGDRRHGF
jgi:thioredoxin reductase